MLHLHLTLAQMVKEKVQQFLIQLLKISQRAISVGKKAKNIYNLKLILSEDHRYVRIPPLLHH